MVDNETFAMLQRRAKTLGITLEAWLRAPEFSSEPVERAASTPPNEWQAQLQEFIALHRPTGAPLDDRRESIYD